VSIDWITVAAQLANFLVLVWLLKRFLYRPILDGIDAREAEISERMKEAAQTKAKAEAAQSEYHDQLAALHFEQSEMTDEMRHKAEKQRDALLAETHERLEQERADWQAHLEEETRKYTAKLHRAGAGALLALTRKALTDLADESLESRIAHHLCEKIASMKPDLQRAAGDGPEAVIVSHDALSKTAQDEMTAQLGAVFPKASLRFETDADQAPGVIVRIGGAQLSWTVDTYIEGLDALMEEQFAVIPDAKVPSHVH